MEIISIEINEIINQKPKKKSWEDKMKHPTFLFAIGFFFTAILSGTFSFFTDSYQRDLDIERNEQKETLELKMKAIENIKEFQSPFAKRKNETVYFKTALQKREIRDDGVP